MFKTGLKLRDNRKAAKALGMGCTGLGQSVSAYDLKSKLAYSPIWTCGKWSSGNNTHIVVVTGIKTFPGKQHFKARQPA